MKVRASTANFAHEPAMSPAEAQAAVEAGIAAADVPSMPSARAGHGRHRHRQHDGKRRHRRRADGTPGRRNDRLRHGHQAQRLAEEGRRDRARWVAPARSYDPLDV